MKYAHVVSEFSLGWIFRTFPQVSASGPQWSPLADADAALACFSSLYLKLALMDTICKSQTLNFAAFCCCSQASKWDTLCHINPLSIHICSRSWGPSSHPLPWSWCSFPLQTSDGDNLCFRYIQILYVN